jgi:hypothetical protein
MTLAEIAGAVRELVRTNHAAYVRNFPIDADHFVEFLSMFGEPLPNYGSKSEGQATDSYRVHPVINQVRYKEREGAGKFVHERGGELRAHSARSWRKQRPAYFSMLMVDPGWRDQEEGANGESILVRWRDALRLLAEQEPVQSVADLELLSRTRICFPANNVVEETSDLPLIYRLDDPEDEYDYGVRLKVDILDKLDLLREYLDDVEAYAAAVRRFIEAANDPAVRISYPMDSGDLVFVDNNRFGHGRRSIVTARDQNGERALNPRELWSVTVA